MSFIIEGVTQDEVSEGNRKSFHIEIGSQSELTIAPMDVRSRLAVKFFSPSEGRFSNYDLSDQNCRSWEDVAADDQAVPCELSLAGREFVDNILESTLRFRASRSSGDITVSNGCNLTSVIITAARVFESYNDSPRITSVIVEGIRIFLEDISTQRVELSPDFPVDFQVNISTTFINEMWKKLSSSHPISADYVNFIKIIQILQERFNGEQVNSDPMVAFNVIARTQLLMRKDELREHDSSAHDAVERYLAERAV